MSKENKFVISKLLDDLTHLEINTIIKKGMTSAPQPEEIEDVLQVLLSDYKEKLGIIHNRNNIEKDIAVEEVFSWEDLYKTLDSLSNFMDENSIRLEESDYIIFLRMKSFCNYLWSRANKIKFTMRKGISDDKSIFTVDMNQASNFKLDLNPRDRMMIKRLFDMKCFFITQSRKGSPPKT